jgi:hypothetical protein
MAPPKWAYDNIFGPLDMSKIHGFPHDMPKDANSWLSKFSGSDDTKANFHLTRFYKELVFHEAQNQHSDVIMRIFSASLVGEARVWYDNLPRKSIKIWEDLENAFIKRWGDGKDLGFLFSQFSEIQKYEQESVREFNDRFNTLMKEFPSKSAPTEADYLEPISKLF